MQNTVLGALSVDYPPDKLKIYVLDDGRREEFREFAEALGVGYITRDNNIHAKAGNLNHALGLTDGEMLALFEFLEATGLGIEWLAAHCRIRGVDEVLSYFEAGHYPSWGDDVAAGYHRPAAAVLTAHSADLGLPRSSGSAARVSSLAAKFEHFSAQYEAMRPAQPTRG